MGHCGQGPGFTGTKISEAERSFRSRLCSNRPVELRNFQQTREPRSSILRRDPMMRVTYRTTAGFHSPGATHLRCYHGVLELQWGKSAPPGREFHLALEAAVRCLVRAL